MHEKYLGDSYDLVKRFWSKGLHQIGPLYAHQRFVPSEIAAKYTALTSIAILDADNPPQRPFGILFDPDTGIPLPTELSREATRLHVPLTFIVAENKRLCPEYMIAFDQSHYRGHQLDSSGQRKKKMRFLKQHGVDSFYYVSHAPFLFMAGNPASLAAVRRQLQSLGIPPRRFKFDSPISDDS